MSDFPKLHAFLAHAGVASRRHAEQAIIDGKVRVNGKMAMVGMRVDPAKDKVEYEGRMIVQTAADPMYILLNKPTGYVSTAAAQQGEQTVMSLVQKQSKGKRVYPVGRLDIDSEGLMLLTDDGDFAYTVTHPKFEIPKTYHVLIQGSPSYTQLNNLRNGVKLKDGMTAPSEVSLVKHDQGNTWIAVTIHEGRHRQVRRMCAHVGLEVLRLIRVRMGMLELGDLAVGKTRTLSQDEVRRVTQKA